MKRKLTVDENCQPMYGVLEFSRETTNSVYMYILRDYFNGLVYVIVGSGRFEIYREEQQAANQAGVDVAVLRQSFSFGKYVFVLKPYYCLDEVHPCYGV